MWGGCVCVSERHPVYMDVEKQLSEYTRPSVRLLYVTRVLVIPPLVYMLLYFLTFCD